MKTNLLNNSLSGLLMSLIQTIIFILLALQLQAQTIPATNTGTVCNYCAPTGWYVVTGSTDISNKSYWAGSGSYPWVGTVNDPPNGHTVWVTGYKLEVVGVDITGLTAGTTYDFDFYKAELQSNAGGIVDPNYDGVLRIYDCNTNVTLGTFPFSGGANNAWTLETLSFAASAPNQSLCFIYINSSVSNGNFWNVSFGSNVVTPSCNMTTSIVPTNPTCTGTATGVVTALSMNGTPPYTYLWNTGSSAPTINGLYPGTYEVTITDAKGCEQTSQTIISDPPRTSILFDVSNVGCDGTNDGSTTAISLGGSPPFSYQWGATAGNQTTTTASNLGVGIYDVTLTDGNHCDAIGSITVNSKDCAPPCPIDYCVEAVINNTNICSVLASNPADPLSTLDCDGDGVANANECTDMTDPMDPCDFEDTSITLPVTADQSACIDPCADLTPIMTILPGNVAGQSPVEVAIQVTELNSLDTDGSVVVVRVPSDPRFVFVWNIGLTTAALVPVQNSDWNYLGDNGVIHTWTYNGPGLVIPANGVSAFGFQSFYDPQSTDGQTTLTATILPFSGGECNPLNNTDSERLVYFK